MRIGVISDTHGVLPEQVKEVLGTCEYIIHAGDVGDPSIIEELDEIAPVFAVRGNVDEWWYKKLPKSVEVTLGGKRIFVIHNKDELIDGFMGADIVIFGHTHRFFEEHASGVIRLNPGSCGKRRSDGGLSCAVLVLDDDGVKIERIDIDRQKTEKDRK